MCLYERRILYMRVYGLHCTRACSIDTYTHILTPTHRHIYRHTYTQTYIYIQTNIHTDIHIHKQICTRIHTYIYTNINTHRHTHKYTYIYTHIHTHIHINTYKLYTIPCLRNRIQNAWAGYNDFFS